MARRNARHKRRCENKRTYRDKATATGAAKKYNAVYGSGPSGIVKPYKCKFGPHYHVGHGRRGVAMGKRGHHDRI